MIVANGYSCMWLISCSWYRRLQWYGRVSRSSGLAKTILQGTVKGGRRRGRRRKRWVDNIRVWTGLEFAESQSAVENRGKWRKLVAKSYVVPQSPSRLRVPPYVKNDATFFTFIEVSCINLSNTLFFPEVSLPLIGLSI